MFVAVKKSSLYLLLIIAVVFAGISCQPELEGDTIGNAEGTLDKDFDGNCKPIIISGAYISTHDLAAQNYLDAFVTITKPGAYVIHTDTVNGFYFTTKGSFETTGNFKVRLQASGKPIASGINDFNIRFVASTCHASVEVRTDSSTSGPATFTFEGSPGNCIDAVVSGTFIQDVALTNNNYVAIKVNVTKPGNYYVPSTSINGYRFEGFGPLLSTGVHTIILYASGVPHAIGTDQFSLGNSNSSCTFPVAVTAGVSNNDRFPLTNGSYWNYDDKLNPPGIIQRSITDSVVLEGKLYKKMVEEYTTGLPQEYFFRKSGDEYFEYGSVDRFTSAVSFVPSINAPVLFLKENLSTGDSWKTIEYKGTSVGTGKPAMLQYLFKCENADATIAINGTTYTQVYNISMEAFTRPNETTAYQTTYEITNVYYAKGIGILYMKKTNQSFNRIEIMLRDWQVR